MIKKKGIAVLMAFCLGLPIIFGSCMPAAGRMGNNLSLDSGNSASTAPSAPGAAGPRKVMNFNSNWKYIFEDDADAKNTVYNEAAAGAEDVSLPHNRDNYDIFTVDFNTATKMDTVNWYRRHFSLDVQDKDKRVIVEFDGGGQINRVYVNGLFVGEKRGTFTHFTFDITDYVMFGDYDNVIALQVDSRFHPEMPPGVVVDYQMLGGLHGEARMTIVDRAHIESVFYYNEPVVYGTASATVNGKADIVNLYGSAQDIVVRSELRDEQNAVVSVKTVSVRLAAGASQTVSFVHTVSKPVLWDLDNPYLYTARTTLGHSALELDRDERSVGIRTFTAGNPRLVGSKFKLNGKEIYIMGANSHMQAPYLGNSLTQKLNVKDAQTLKYELGLHMVRLSHYQQSPAFLAECDRIGLLVEEEALSWQDLPDFEGQFAYSVREMVKRDRNHASIVMWSIFGNENTQVNGPSIPVRQALNAEVKGLDPSRLTIQEEVTNSAIVADVYGVHDYTAPHLASKENVPDLNSWVASEWNNNTGQSFVIANDSELRQLKQLLNYARKMEAFNQSDNVMGSFVWNSNGYLTRIGTYDKGKVLDNYRSAGIIGPMRDALDKLWTGYLFQSQRSQAEVGPVLQICSDWKQDSAALTSVERDSEADGHPLWPTPSNGEYEPPANAVYVASNFDKVSLYYVDGASKTLISTLTAPNRSSGMVRGLYEFRVNKAWTATSKLVAEGYNGEETTPSGVNTRFASTLNIDKSATTVKLNNTIGEIQADGSDVAWIVAEMIDKNGQRAKYAEENIKVEKVSGAGEVVYGGKQIKMSNGMAGYYVRSALDKPGVITSKVSVDIGESFDDSAVCFSFDGNWTLAGNVADAFEGAYRKSKTNGASVTVTFTGTQIALYGEHRSNFGTADISVDGGSATAVSYKSNNKYGVIGNQRMYISPTLNYGTHTLTITATSSEAVVVDRVKVFDGEFDATAAIDVKVNEWTEARVALPAVATPPASGLNAPELVIQSILYELESVDLSLYTVSSRLLLNDAAAAGQTILGSTGATKAQLRAAAESLRSAYAGLVTNKSLYNRIDHSDRGLAGETGRVFFSGNWITESDGDGVYSPRSSRSDSDYYSITFYGTGISVYSRMADTYGYGQVSLDGGPEQQVNFFNRAANSPQATGCVFTISNLSKGMHTVKVRVQATSTVSGHPDTKNGVIAFSYALIEGGDIQGAVDVEQAKINLLSRLDIFLRIESDVESADMDDFISIRDAANSALRSSGVTVQALTAINNEMLAFMNRVGGSGEPVQTGTIHHSSDKAAAEGEVNKVYYYSENGCWTSQATGDSKGMYTYSAKATRKAGDYYSITFEGRQIELYTIMKSNHGLAKIYIDGAEIEDVDFYMNLPDMENTTDINLVYKSPVLSYGTHTIKVVFIDQPTQNPSNCVVSFAYAKIFS